MDHSFSTDLRIWLKTLPIKEQELFFKQAARFFSNRELTEIIGYIRNHSSLYTAHEKTGVLERYAVDLKNIQNTWAGRFHEPDDPERNH